MKLFLDGCLIKYLNLRISISPLLNLVWLVLVEGDLGEHEERQVELEHDPGHPHRHPGLQNLNNNWMYSPLGSWDSLSKVLRLGTNGTNVLT